MTVNRQENPPDFLVEAHKDALSKVECNQYGPTGVSVLLQ